MTKYIILLFLTLASINSVKAQNCSQLTDGSYVIELDSFSNIYTKYRYEIIKNKCYIIDDGEKKEYDIIRLSKCSFRFKSNLAIDTTNFTPLQKYLHNQQPFFEIYKVEGDIYYFENRIDLHISGNSGRFIRVMD